MPRQGLGLPMNDTDRLLEVLDDAECLRLLRTQRVGRLGFTDAALPAILPVGFTVTGRDVRIPARVGDRVLTAIHRTVVALGVDHYDVDTRTGWGVTVVGPSRVLPLEPPGSATPPVGGAVIVVPFGLLRGWRLSARTGTDVESPTVEGERPSTAGGAAPYPWESDSATLPPWG